MPSFALEHPEGFRGRSSSLGDMAGCAGLAASRSYRISSAEVKSRRTAIDDAADGRSMAFAE